MFIQLAPIVGHAHRKRSFVVGAESRRWIFHAAARCRVGISGPITVRIIVTLVWIVVVLVWITSSAALNLSHRLRARITIQPFLNAAELAIVSAHRGIYAQVLGFLIDARVAVLRAGVITKKTAAPAALRLDRAKHI